MTVDGQRMLVTISGLASVEVDGKTFIVVAGSTSFSLSVFQLDRSGKMTMTDAGDFLL